MSVCACVQTQRAPVGVVSGAAVCVARLVDTKEEDEEEIERNSANGSMCARVLLHVSVRTRLRLYAHALCPPGASRWVCGRMVAAAGAKTLSSLSRPPSLLCAHTHARTHARTCPLPRGWHRRCKARRSSAAGQTGPGPRSQRQALSQHTHTHTHRRPGYSSSTLELETERQEGPGCGAS